jgi:hypothetical protein
MPGHAGNGDRGLKSAIFGPRIYRRHAMNTKFREIAALALTLAAWYLLGPPQNGGPADFDLHAPLSKWKVIDTTDDISACETGRMVLQGQWYKKADADPVGTKDALKDAAMLIWLGDAKCVSAADPRLKAK